MALTTIEKVQISNSRCVARSCSAQLTCDTRAIQARVWSGSQLADDDDGDDSGLADTNEENAFENGLDSCLLASQMFPQKQTERRWQAYCSTLREMGIMISIDHEFDD